MSAESAGEIRCEWGVGGVAALHGCRTFIVVDVLSFTTCVSIAVGRGAVVFPFAWRDQAAVEFARGQQALLAGTRGQGATPSLSPASLQTLAPGARLVLPSPNGAVVTLAAQAHGHVLAGCLRNRAAICARAAALGGPFAIVPAGERWADGSLRPAVEDLAGAGAIAALLPGTRSIEAAAAVAVWGAMLARQLPLALAASVSGRELVTRGFADDVAIAAQLDCDHVVPQLIDGAFRAQPGPAEKTGAGHAD